jgi:hypothetical protein
MKSAVRGKSISKVEILNISSFGIWLLADKVEYFADYANFPWFKEANLGDILNVEMPHPGHLYWPKLDIDLALESLVSPEKYPLVSRNTGRKKVVR